MSKAKPQHESIPSSPFNSGHSAECTTRSTRPAVLRLRRGRTIRCQDGPVRQSAAGDVAASWGRRNCTHDAGLFDPLFGFCQRACAALRFASLSCLLVIFATRAFPPFLPRATAAGSFCLFIEIILMRKTKNMQSALY
jgi:hypothetical protein